MKTKKWLQLFYSKETEKFLHQWNLKKRIEKKLCFKSIIDETKDFYETLIEYILV